MKVTTSFDRKSSSGYKNNKKITKIGVQNNYENNKYIEYINNKKQLQIDD